MKKLKTYDLRSYRELEKFGFRILTGEACNLGIRLLVDMNEEAANLMSQFMGGLNPTNRNYNPESVKSCFIPTSTEFLKYLLIFCILSTNENAHVLELKLKNNDNDNFLVVYDSFNNDNEEVKRIREHYHIRHYSINAFHPRRGLANVSSFTGRSQ